MPSSPTDTVTFLFTDIEGSTRHWDQHPEAMKIALARHDTILRSSIEARGGHVFKTGGDGFYAAFPVAPDALAAALEAQRLLATEPWGEMGELRVRMALHTGAVQERDGDYFGPPLNRVARLLSAGHGGQTLLSLATQKLVRDHLPECVHLRDLGTHRLRDLILSEQIFDVVAPPLSSVFPVLKTLDASAQQEVKRRRRQLMFLGVAALLCLGAALGWWDYTRVKTAYYQDVTSRYSVPEGVIELSTDKVQHRENSYRVESSRHKVRRVTEINGSGYPVDDSDKHNASTGEIHYRENGELDFIAYLNHNGREVFRETYSDLRDNGAGGKRHFVDFKLYDKNAPATQSSGFSLLGVNLSDYQQEGPKPKTDIAGEILDYTADGRTERVQYRNAYGSTCSNGDGVIGQHFEYNPMGQETKVTNLGPDGKLFPDQRGVAMVVLSYDAFRNLVGLAYSGVDNQPVLCYGHFAEDMLKYDEKGNKIEEDFFGIDGQPVLGDYGYAKVTIQYDKHGNKIEEAYFGVEGRPVLRRGGVAKCTRKYDERGNTNEEAYFGVDGQPIARYDGVATWKFKHDRHGNQIERATFGVKGQPVFDIFGVAQVTCKFDEQGNEIEEAFFGVDGLPVLHRDGFAKVTDKYDERGNIIEAAFFGVDGKPVLRTDGHYAKLTYKYDERGNLIELAYFGVDGQPVLNIWGTAKFTFKHDERGNTTERTYYGIDNQPGGDKDGIFKETRKYDARGNQIELAYFGVDGHPIEVKGACRIVYTRDTTGKVIKTDRFDAKGKLVP